MNLSARSVSRTNEYKKWLSLAAGTVLLLFMGVFYTWSVFRIPLQRVFTAWTDNAMTLVFTAGMSAFCLSNWLCGRMLRKLSTQKMLLLSAVISVIGYLGTTLIAPLPDTAAFVCILILYGGCAGTATGFAYTSVLSAVASWFPGKTGTVSGVLMTGFGLGGFFLGLLIQNMLEQISIFQVLLFLGLLLGAANTAGAFLIAKNETETDDSIKMTEHESAEKSSSPKEMTASPLFWLLFAFCLCIGFAGLTVIGSAVPIALAYHLPSMVGLLVTIANTLGRIVFGSLLDKNMALGMGSIAGLMFAGGLFLCIGAFLQQPGLVIPGLLFLGMCYGSNGPVQTTVVRRYFGPKYFPENFGISTLSVMLSSIMIPIVSAPLYENGSGDYSRVFLAVALIGALILVVFLFFERKRKQTFYYAPQGTP